MRERVDVVSATGGLGRRRRTPGLRREEVAERAGVSVDWYIRLEQGRASRPSAAVLDALAGALDLSAAERKYLFRVSRGEAPEVRPSGASVDASLAAALGAIANEPAIILGPRFDVLATNALGQALFDGFATGPFGRNAAWFTLCDPRARVLFPDYAKVARETVGIVRGGFAKHLGDAQYFALVTELSQRSPLFVQHWPEQYVTERGAGRKRFRHPRAGLLDLDVHSLSASEAAGQVLVLYTARDAETRARVPKLLPPRAPTARRRGRKAP